MKIPASWKTLLVLPVVAAFWSLMPKPAAADTIWNLTTFNTTNPTVTSPYATVEVNGNAATGSVVFTITVTPANQSVATLGEFGFNVSSSVATAAAADGFKLTFNSGSSVVAGTGNTSAWTTTMTTPGPAVFSSNTSMDGYGKFGYVVGPTNTANVNRMTTYTFTWQFNNSADFGLATDANFAQPTTQPPGNAGHIFAAHLFPNTGNTGFIDGASPAVVPEPPSLALGLLGFVALTWRQIRRLVRRNPLALA